MNQHQMRAGFLLASISLFPAFSRAASPIQVPAASASAHPAPASLAHPSPSLKGDPSHPAHGIRWVDTQLYFGLGPADSPEKGISEAMWRSFLDKEITPRFPAGFSVLDVYGQWKGKEEAAPERIRSKMLVVDYPATAANDAKVEAIRAAWKKMTGDQSVLKVTHPADISF